MSDLKQLIKDEYETITGVDINYDWAYVDKLSENKFSLKWLFYINGTYDMICIIDDQGSICAVKFITNDCSYKHMPVSDIVCKNTRISDADKISLILKYS